MAKTETTPEMGGLPPADNSAAYVEGYKAGYALGYGDGKGVGYIDAKTRAFLAVEALNDTNTIPRGVVDTIRETLRNTLGAPA